MNLPSYIKFFMQTMNILKVSCCFPRLDSIKEKASQWKEVTKPRQYAIKFPYVYDSVIQYVASKESPEIRCHTKCRKYFGDPEKLEANLNDFISPSETECISMSDDDMNQTFCSTSAGNTLTTRSKVVHLPSPSDQERKCFVCNKRRKKV